MFKLEHVGSLLAIEGPEDQRFDVFESAERTTWLLAILGVFVVSDLLVSTLRVRCKQIGMPT